MNEKPTLGLFSGLLYSLLIILLFAACSKNSEEDKSIKTDEMALSDKPNKHSMYTPALKRAINLLEVQGDTLTNLSVILLVDENAADDEVQQLTNSGIILSQQINNKWIIKSSISNLEMLKNFDWIKSADVSQTRNMK